jgi:hypothetical protein
MTIAQISATASQLEILQKINETITVSSEVKENYVSKSGATFTGSVTAPSFIGRLEGTVATAETASKAQQDQDGVNIATNYAKLNNPTFTGTVTAPTFSGNLTGTATKATQDGNGATIANTYAKLSGATFTNWIYATGFKVNSDLNLKENLVEIEDALEKCNTLTGYTYNFKDTPNVRHGGLIAQDIQKVLPESVSENSGKLVVDYNGVVALLVEAVKELSAKVEKLEVKCE